MTDTDFLVSVELFVSPQAATALRKNRSRAEKRPGKTSLAEESKRLREKTSWLSIGKNQDAGHWRNATCKLTEDGERCLLNIYVDESILFQTVFIHLLNHTDIRPADTSLFFRKHCLGIYSAGGQRWATNHTAEPIYLHFPSADLCNVWLALLRSYAVAEIYGTWAYPEDGGAYRMWRQVDLTIIQARNLASPSKTEPYRKFVPDGSSPARFLDQGVELEALDVEVSCEIQLNEITCGKTTTKKGLGSMEWHENFIFPDLPPFDGLDIVVWKEKRLLKPSILGRVHVVLKNFRRGETVDGFFPILQEGSVAGDLQVGDLRLKVRVEEEIILPYRLYSPLLNTFNSRNLLHWIADCESKLNLKTLSPQLMSLAVAKNVLIRHIQEQAEAEVDGTPASHQTLFRGNTVLTKVMEISMSFYGKAFLEVSIGSSIRRLCDEKVAIEVDPARNTKGMKDVERMVDLLIYWCEEFWSQIYRARNECPVEMRSLFGTIRRLVEQRYQQDELQKTELPWQSVSAFCFLRFIVPALLHPHLFGLVPGLPSSPVQRSLTLIAKVIQSLANLNVTVQKEEFMRGVKNWLTESLPSMIDYISVVSSGPEETFSTTSSVPDRHGRLHVMNSLRQRAVTMSPLAREAVPSLPYLLDTPRHLSIVTSAVIRHAGQQRNSSTQEDAAVKELCSQCFRVEEEALRRVSQLATRINAEQQMLVPPTPPKEADRRTRRRPSTAPSSDSDTAHHASFQQDKPPSETLMATHSTSPSRRTNSPEQVRRPPHLKSPSSDAIPIHTPRLHKQSESYDDPNRKPKGLLRGILRR